MPITADEAAVKKALDDLTVAMLAAEKAKLEAGVVDQLSFGHANGHIQDKAEFVTVIASKKAIYKSITFMEQPTVRVIGDAAVVRYTTAVEVGSISLKLVVLQVWVKDGAAWKLLEHQATKL